MKSAYILIILIFVSCIWQPTVNAQSYTDRISFDHLTDKEGLSQRTVESILQDSEGYMWFGTHDGLNRYNGYEMTVYRSEENNPNSLSYNQISDLLEDSNKNLWVATHGGGLNLYDRDKDHFIRYDYSDLPEVDTSSLNEKTIYNLTEGPDGRIWLGTENGIFLLDSTRTEFDYIPAEPEKPGGLSYRAVSVLYTDSRGDVWVGTHNGLNLLPKGKQSFTRFFHDPKDSSSISNNYIQSIYEDSQGVIWIGTQRGGLNRFHRDSATFHSYVRDPADPFSISDNSVYSILEDSRGALWIGTENEGLNLFDRNSGRFYHQKQEDKNPRSLNNNAIYSIYEDNDQKLWIGTYNGGVNITDRKAARFEHYRHDPFQEQSLSSNSVLSFLEDSNENIWIGTDGGGLNHFDKENGTFKTYRHNPEDPESIPGDVIFDMVEDENGHIWIATYRNSLVRFDPGTESFKHFPFAPDTPGRLNHNDVFALHIDERQPELLWIGTNGGGVNLLNTQIGEFNHFTVDPNDPHSINNEYIRYFHEDSRGTFRIGNYGGSLVTYNRESGRFSAFDLSDDGFNSNVVQMIFEDSSGRLWVSTWGGGLKLITSDNQILESYTQQKGLPNNYLHGILEDNNGNLWISSNRGLTEFNPDTEEFRNYGIENGLQSWEFNPRAVLKDRAGYMYFGGVDGFNRFHPDSISIEDYKAPVVLSEFRIFNEPMGIDGEDSPLDKHISRTDKLILNHRQSVLTFDYVSLNYDINKGDEYAYKLEGFDTDWNYVGSRRSATYTNLAQGEYTFRVKAANSSGVWSDKEASVDLVITPPFWRTTWFYIVSILFTGIVIGGGLRWRMRSVTLQNKRLEREVTRQTLELSDKNAELTGTLKDLKETRSELVEKAHKAGMADLATNVLHNVGNILNSVNISASLTEETLRNSNLKKLKKANKLLREHAGDLKSFILNNPKGETLLQYYLKLEEPVAKEYKDLMAQNKRLIENIKLIIDVVNTQQSFSKAGRIYERVDLKQLTEDTLILQSATIERHGLEIVKEYNDVDKVNVERSKMIHTLVNLLKNAKEAMGDLNPEQKKLTLKTWQDDNFIYLSINDTGTGVKKEHLKRMFNHGFTTKAKGHGYGLHSCANYMKELKGTINIESEGEQKGTTVTLGFPRDDADGKKQIGANPDSELIGSEVV